MADQQGLTLPAAPQAQPGLPENFHLLTFDGFDGLNTKPSRPAIKDQEMSYCDNFMPLGKSNLRTLYDVGAAIFTVSGSGTLSYYDFANIVNTSIAVVLISDGSLLQVNTTTMATLSMAPSGTVTTPANLMAISQWGSQYILMTAPQTNGYFVWDGTVFYRAGTIGPSVNITNSGQGYGGVPNVAGVGGHGTGATFAPTVTSSGAVSQIIVSNAGSGYGPNDFVTLAFSSGGGNTTAIATASIAGGAVVSTVVLNSGTGYTANVKVAVMGGGGINATITATASGVVSALTITNPGEGYTSNPTLVFTDTGNSVAQATVATMPFGLQGSCLETFTNRVWIGNGNAPAPPPPLSLVDFSAPGSPTDFSIADGGGSFLSTDSFLRVGFHSLKQSNGFMYLIGDSSVNYIAGVTTSGNPPITTFSNQNVDPQVGTPWPDTVKVYSRAIVFANTYGVHAMYGGAVQKVSTPLDGIFTTVTPSGNAPSYSGLIPSAAVAIIFGIHVYMLLLPIIDPLTGKQRNALLMWDGQKWWTAGPSVTLIRIASQEINSVLTAYGSDGKSIYPLFQTPSNAITKTVQSKLWDAPSYIMTKQPQRLFGLITETSGDIANLTVTVQSENSSQTIIEANLVAATWSNNAAMIATWLNNSSNPATWQAVGTASFVSAVNGVSGTLIGLTATTTTQDLTLISLSLVEQQYKLDL